MIEITLPIYNRAERDILNQALDDIDELRQRGVAKDMPAWRNVENVPVTTTELSGGTAMITFTADPAPELGLAIPCGDVSIPFEADEQEESAEVLVTRYLKEHGMAAATKLLADYGVKRVGELPAEKRKQLVAALVSR